MKGGATVTPLRTPTRGKIQGLLIERSIEGASHYPDMHGFVVIAWNGETTWSNVVIDNAAVVNRSTVPHFAAEEVRRALHQSGDW
jgi:hypothetical protein